MIGDNEMENFKTALTRFAVKTICIAFALAVALFVSVGANTVYDNLPDHLQMISTMVIFGCVVVPVVFCSLTFCWIVICEKLD
jgi:cytochrome bd-type quinol oxidase subunit 2